MTYNDFYQHICDLPTHFAYRDLERYLAAMYGLVLEHRHDDLDAPKLLLLIEKAFSAEPFPFDSAWLDINNPPLKYGEADQWRGNEAEYTLQVLRFQMADLQKMQYKRIPAETRYFGVDSETGHRWYNFDPFNILECGMRGWMDLFDEVEEVNDAEDANDECSHSVMRVSWQTLGELLEMGRMYE